MNEIPVLRADKWVQVRGVTSLGEELYILFNHCFLSHLIAVYSKTDFTFLRAFSVPGLSQHGIQDMSSCARLDCLLIANSDRRCLHKIMKNGKNSPEMWPLSDKPYGLSAGKGGNVSVLVACCGGSILSNTGKLMELNTLGHCVREIILKPWVASLWHAVELSSGEFVIAYRSYWCARGEAIGIVDKSGRVKQSYGDWWKPSSETDTLKGTLCMAVDNDGFVFLADNEKCRVVLLTPSLRFLCNIVTNFPPRWLHLDQKSRRLFVGYDVHTVDVFQL